MHVSIAIVRSLIEELELRGEAGSALLTSVGLSSALLDDPLERVDIETYVRLVDGALAVTGDERLGLAIGSRVPTTTVHVVAHAALACRTLRDAWLWFSNASRLVLSEGRFSLRDDDGVFEFVYEHPVMPRRLATYDADFCLALIYRIARAIAPNAALYRVEFRHEAPRDIAPYKNVFDADVRFGCAENAIFGDARALDVPQRHADPVLLSLLRGHTDRLLAELSAERYLLARIRHLVRSSECPVAIGADDVARALDMPVHSLRRALMREGKSVRVVLDEALREIACAYLENARMSVKEVAYALGFSEPSAFHRAFKRWMGKTPAEFRSAQT